MKKTDLSIGDVAAAAGISTSALRFYESIGLLPEPPRVNGRRRYDDSVFAPLAAIRLAQESGFTVAEIKQILESCRDPSAGQNGRWKELAASKIEELDRTMARTAAMKELLAEWLVCECVSLDDCELVARKLDEGRSPAPQRL